MHSLTLTFGQNGTVVVWMLMFRQPEKASEIFATIKNTPRDGEVDVTDDFGQQAWMQRSAISGMLLEDMQVSMGSHIERALHQARMQHKAQEAASKDPQIRMPRTGGPAIISPMGNGMGTPGAFRG